MRIQERVLRGFVAGFLAGLVMMVVDQGAVFFKLSTLGYDQWASVFSFGHLPHTIWERVLGQGGHVVFCAFMGLVYALLVQSESNSLGKGMIWGLFIWLSSYWISVLFKVDQLYPRTIGTVLADFLTALVFGWSLSKAYRWLEPENWRRG